MTNSKKPAPKKAHALPWIITDNNRALKIRDGLDKIFGRLNLKAAGDADRADVERARYKADETAAQRQDRERSIPPFSDADWGASGSRIRSPSAADLVGTTLRADEAMLVVVKRLPGGVIKRFRVAGPTPLVARALTEERHPLFDAAQHYLNIAQISDSGWRRL